MGITLFITTLISFAFGFNSADYTNFTERTLNHQNGEICVMPAIPSIGSFSHSKKDQKNDAKLCALDHYKKMLSVKNFGAHFLLLNILKLKLES